MKDIPEIVRELKEAEKLEWSQSQAKNNTKESDIMKDSYEDSPDKTVATFEDSDERQTKEGDINHEANKETLQDAEERWSSLLENTDDIIIVVDNNSTMQYINKTIPPYTPEETIGKSIYDYVPNNQHDIMRNSLEKIFKTGIKNNYEVSSDVPEVGTVWFSTKAVPIKRDGEIVGVILISTDITEKKKANEALQNAKEKLEKKVDELERYKKVSVGRELKMIELKKRIKELEKGAKK